jgi:DNA-binding CsgD family transcriptional regulator
MTVEGRADMTDNPPSYFRGHMTASKIASGSIRLDSFGDFLSQLNACLKSGELNEALRALARALTALADDVSVYVGFYRRDAPPIVLEFDGPDEWNRLYPNGYYLLDPTYEAFAKRSESACLLPQEVFPRDFRTSEYYLSYYRPYRMVDEVCFLLYLQPDLAAYVSLMRLGDAPPYSQAECRRLSAALPAMETAARHIWPLHNDKTGTNAIEESARALHHHLARAYEHFGKETLSEREADVTRLLLKGLSPKAVGRLLKIAPGTVRNHIKRIYVKLGVRSQAELLAYFFEVLSNSASAPAED